MTRVLIIGAGPAGLAAARAARRAPDTQVTLIDDNPSAGGQIWRGEPHTIEGVETHFGSAVFALQQLTFDKLILATGARELFLPFPGWTLPHVMGAGGLQALVKGGFTVSGKRIVVAGTGPLLLAVAAYLRSRGATIACIAEQALASRVLPFVLRSGKLWQGVKLRAQLAGVPYRMGSWIESTRPGEVTLHVNGKSRNEPTDLVAAAFGLWPNTELAQLAGCRLNGPFVEVDACQRTSIPNIYCAGEPTGIGGVDKAQLEGEIAGCHATGQAAPKPPDRAFVDSLARAFALREEVKQLAANETIVCRCEDVSMGELRRFPNWREAKLQTRCGMGPCQGRICGPALHTILGSPLPTVREPAFPVSIGSLLP